MKLDQYLTEFNSHSLQIDTLNFGKVSQLGTLWEWCIFILYRIRFFTVHYRYMPFFKLHFYTVIHFPGSSHSSIGLWHTDLTLISRYLMEDLFLNSMLVLQDQSMIPLSKKRRVLSVGSPLIVQSWSVGFMYRYISNKNWNCSAH